MSNIRKAQNQTETEKPRCDLGACDTGKKLGEKLSANPQNNRKLNKNRPNNFDDGRGYGESLVWAFLGGALFGAVLLAAFILCFVHR